MLTRLYNLLVNKTTGRKWTYILRDRYHDAPLEWLLVWSFFVSLLANLVTAQWELVFWGAVGFGALLGHLFWGSRWKRGQQ